MAPRVPPSRSRSLTWPGVFTHHNDNARTGQNLKEYALSPSTVSATTFGKLFSCTLDAPGYVYAEPLYVANLTMNDGKKHNVVFVVTESDWVYAYDADSSSCQQLWKKSMLAPGETTVPFADTGELNDLTPEIGITSTPVIDVNAGLIYVCAKSKDVNVYFHRLHALSLVSGAEHDRSGADHRPQFCTALSSAAASPSAQQRDRVRGFRLARR